ncbi:MAG: major facilitator superfamily domain-containing protein 1 [Proteobacteria bacterium]|nr:major facilitator superfamily domain-containing protein 1 [Pseudomonadota bacterium]
MQKTKEQIGRSLGESVGLRWGILFLVSFAMATNYYFYDVLSPIQDLLESELGITPTQYGTIFLFYSFPNTFFFMAVLGGIICDKLGIRITGTMFFVSMMIGCVLTYYGCTDYFISGGLGYDLMSSFLPEYSPALKMMCTGFLFFGLGAETSCVVISKAVVKWFKGKELGLALGVNIGVARLASSAVFAVGAWLSKPDFTRPVALGVAIMTAGFLAFLVYLFFDKAFDKNATDMADDDEEPFRVTDVFKLLVNPSYIFVALLCVVFYSAVFPFNKYAVDMLQNKFHMAKQTAAFYMFALPIAQAFITPLFGWVCDFKGKSATLMILGSVMLAMGHMLLSLTTIHPAVAMVLLGMAFSLVPAAMWPALAKISDEKRLGTAYGLTFSIQNFGLAFTPVLIGYVLEASNPDIVALKQKALEAVAGPEGEAIRQAAKTAVYDYTNPILMLSVFGIIGIFFAILLKRADKTSGFGLELPNKTK